MNPGELGRLHGRSTHEEIHRRRISCITFNQKRRGYIVTSNQFNRPTDDGVNFFSMILILIFTIVALTPRLSIRNILYQQRNYRRSAKHHLDREV